MVLEGEALLKHLTAVPGPREGVLGPEGASLSLRHRVLISEHAIYPLFLPRF